MKKLAIIVLLFFAYNTNAQDISELDNKITTCIYLSNNFDNKELYDSLRFEKNKKFYKLEELSAFEQKILFITSAQKLAYKMEAMKDKWEENLKKIELEKIDEISVLDNRIRQLDFVFFHLIGRWRNLTINTFNTYPDDFTASEKTQYLKTINKWKLK